MTTSISIRFLRKNGSTKTDDKIIIRRLGMNQFNLNYTYGDTKTKNTHKLFLTDKAVFRWMRHTISLLEKDNDPFHAIQVDFPFMPSVLFEIKNLSSAYNTLLDALEFHLDNWPAPHPPLNPEEDADMSNSSPQSPTLSAHGRHLFLD